MRPIQIWMRKKFRRLTTTAKSSFSSDFAVAIAKIPFSGWSRKRHVHRATWRREEISRQFSVRDSPEFSAPISAWDGKFHRNSLSRIVNIVNIITRLWCFNGGMTSCTLCASAMWEYIKWTASCEADDSFQWDLVVPETQRISKLNHETNEKKFQIAATIEEVCLIRASWGENLARKLMSHLEQLESFKADFRLRTWKL